MNNNFNWAEIIQEASEKECGLELSTLVQIIKGLPQEKFDAIKWINKPEWSDFQRNIDKIVSDLLLGQDNLKS